MVSIFCSLKFRQDLNLHSPCFAEQNGHIIDEKLTRLASSSPVISTTSSRTLYRSWRLFLLKNPSLTHAVVPPFRNRSRSSRLFGCKRPHNGFVSLPPCFGWGGISKFDLCLFIWRLYCNRLFSYIRLTASSIATQWYSAFSRVILPASVEKANIISLCRRHNITFAKAKISRRTKWGISQKSNKMRLSVNVNLYPTR